MGSMPEVPFNFSWPSAVLWVVLAAGVATLALAAPLHAAWRAPFAIYSLSSEGESHDGEEQDAH